MEFTNFLLLVTAGGVLTVPGWVSAASLPANFCSQQVSLCEKELKLKKKNKRNNMHLIEAKTSGATTSGSPEPTAEQRQLAPAMVLRQQHNKSRPWDYDTEDSGVDSVSSLAGLEAESGCVGGSVEYSAVIVNNNKVNNDVVPQQRKSFLHTVYGGVQQQPLLDCNANKNPLRKNVSKRGGQDGHRSVESAKNNFLHSLLDDETKAVSSGSDPPPLPMESASSTSAMALDLLPELVQLLDANGVMDGGLIELVGRDGTRASLRVTLAPPTTSQTCTSNTSSAAASRKNSFNTRLHRNSKRASQRRSKLPVPPAATEANTTTTTTASDATKSASSSASAPSLASASVSSGGAGFIAQRPRSVRRRPSSSSFHKKVPGFSVSMAIPPSKVAILASKFNSLINESRRGGNTSAAAATTRDKNLSAAAVVTSGTSTTETQSSAWSWRLVPAAESAGQSVKRNASISSVRPSIDTIPEIIDPPEEGGSSSSAAADYCKPRRKSHDLSQPSGKLHSVARPLPSDPVRHHQQQGQQSVYGTVMSIVKQAIRKFEKLEGGNSLSTVSETANDAASAAPAASDQTAASSDVEPPVVIPEGIAPNSSFLWRDQKSMQNLIYEATSFSERAAATALRTQHEPSNYYEMGKYDTLRSRRSNAYDTLQHPNNNKSSSSSSSGYDEIRSPGSSASNPSAVKYDDVKMPQNCVTYDELSYLGRRQSNGYDELRSPPSTTSSGGYIDPGSSSALGYERILPPEDQQMRGPGEQNEDEDGSTLRYEECGSPSSAAQNALNTVTALPAIVCEDQMDSISYLYDDIRAVGLGRSGIYGCYSGSNHSYEPIYAHLGDGSSKIDSSANQTNDKSSDTLSGKHLWNFLKKRNFLFLFINRC